MYVYTYGCKEYKGQEFFDLLQIYMGKDYYKYMYFSFILFSNWKESKVKEKKVTVSHAFF